jgi:hypothetical protein
MPAMRKGQGKEMPFTPREWLSSPQISSSELEEKESEADTVP